MPPTPLKGEFLIYYFWFPLHLSPADHSPLGGRGFCIKKGLPYGNPSEYYVKKQKTELPYDYSLSHHQLLFNAIIFICCTNMEIVFTKSKQNDKFTQKPKSLYLK